MAFAYGSMAGILRERENHLSYKGMSLTLPPCRSSGSRYALIFLGYGLLFSAQAQSNWKSWQREHGLVGVSEQAIVPGAKHSALMQYFLDENPQSTASSKHPRGAFQADGNLSISFDASRDFVPDDLFVQFYTTTDLTNGDWAAQPYSFSASEDAPGRWSQTFSADVGAISGPIFYRLGVTRDPSDAEVTPIENQTIAVNSGALSLPFSIENLDSSATGFAISATSGNATLFPETSISISGSSPNFTLNLASPNSIGIALFELTITDGAQTAKHSFSVTVAGGLGEQPDGYDIILVWGQSNERGVDGAIDLELDTDPTGRIQQFALSGENSGSIIDIDDGTIYTPIASGAVVGPGFSFAKAYAETLAANRKVLIVPVCVGGTSYIGNPRWNPYGDGIDENGDLYLLAISAVNDALAAAQAIYPDSCVVGFYGGPGENDAGAQTYADFIDRHTEVIRSFRQQITGAGNAWAIKSGMVPEWALSGAYGRLILDAAQVRAEEILPYYAFSEGVAGYQYVNENDVLESIHYNAGGNRLKGANAAALVPIAKSRSTPVDFPADVYSGIGAANATDIARPELAVGLRRLVKGYTGPALNLRNDATGETRDIFFQANGELDAKSIELLSGSNHTYITRLYDQSGHGRDLTAPTAALQSQFTSSGALFFKGRRPAFNRDKRTGFYACADYDSPAFATVIGRIPLRNCVALGTNSIMLYRPGGGNLAMMPGGQQIINDFGENYVAIAADAATQRIWVDGVSQTLQSASTSSYGGSGISFMALNSDGTKPVRGEFSELALWGDGLTEAEITRINETLAAYTAWNSIESSAAE
ncbi:sialate O-acetylesterase [Cerasicoccus maritimus]|uniref:sialate O-acetylesterase n=1 Tax=Cerasicoccus maritimus TaxID=490089 RepID=UPI002852A80D|nr:sialate O-acetylesterase [Cerasicoccus maritimus]